MLYAILREWFIAGWHIIVDGLNYPIKPGVRKKLDRNRAFAKERRLAKDAAVLLKKQEAYRVLQEKRQAERNLDPVPDYVPPTPIISHAFCCPNCGSACAMKSEAKNDASGCFLIIVGLCLCPLLIGIPILIYGFIHGAKTAKFWACPKCRCRYDAY